jgi:hypothetical protein
VGFSKDCEMFKERKLNLRFIIAAIISFVLFYSFDDGEGIKTWDGHVFIEILSLDVLLKKQTFSYFPYFCEKDLRGRLHITSYKGYIFSTPFTP